MPNLASSLAVVLALSLGTISVSAQASSSSAEHSAEPVSAARAALLGTDNAARGADFGSEKPSASARQVADWVHRTGDSAGAHFLIVDKQHARLYVLDGNAVLLGASPVLLGAAVGDHTVPGIGLRPLSQVQPFERTTPAGRFVAKRGRNTRGEDVVWVDYEAAVSLHRVRATQVAERRLQRLASPSSSDNRISWGCINVPVDFYDRIVRPIFQRQRGMIYVLPEVRSLQEVFGPCFSGSCSAN